MEGDRPTWFENIAAVENPNINELRGFVKEVTSFLNFTLTNDSFHFLWKDDADLRRLALETFKGDVLPHSTLLLAKMEIPSPSFTGRLIEHGLIGRPMRFKLKVLNSIAKRWERLKGQFTIREWLKRMFEAIDAILDSLIDAAGAVGAVIKEFKDALSALVSTDDENGVKGKDGDKGNAPKGDAPQGDASHGMGLSKPLKLHPKIKLPSD
jgi:hypothetical protein